MPLKTYDTKDAVPEAQRTTAIETKDGKFLVEEPVDVASLRAEGQRALDAERERANTEEKARKAVEKKLADKERAETAEGKGVQAAELQRLRDEDAAARKPLEDRIATLEAENKTIRYSDRLKALGLKYGIMPDRIDDAMLILEKRTAPDDKGGITVLDKDGKVSTQVIDDFLEKTFKTEKSYFYAGPGGSGGGGEQGGGGGTGYDPVAAGKAAGEKQKQQQAAASSLAFK